MLNLGLVSDNRNITLQMPELQAFYYPKMSTAAERLIEAREDKGWKKSDLRRAAKLKSPSTLTEMEKGLATESPQWAIIADALGVEVLWLQHGKGPKHRDSTLGVNDGYVASEALKTWQDAVNALNELLKNEPPAAWEAAQNLIKYEQQKAHGYAPPQEQRTPKGSRSG